MFHEPWASYAIPEGSQDDVECLKYSSANNDSMFCLPSDFNNVTQQCSQWVYDKTEFESTIVTQVSKKIENLANIYGLLLESCCGKFFYLFLLK